MSTPDTDSASNAHSTSGTGNISGTDNTSNADNVPGTPDALDTSGGISIRLATEAQIAELQALESLSGRRFALTDMPELADCEPMPAALLRARIRQGQVKIAVNAQGRLLAFVAFREVDDCYYIEQIDVSPRAERQRIGAALLDHVSGLAKARSLRGLLLSTFSEIAWNAPYYRRLGFADIPQAELSPSLLAIREEHIARGLDEQRRTFQFRPL